MMALSGWVSFGHADRGLVRSHAGRIDRNFPIQTLAAFAAALSLGGDLRLESVRARFIALVFGSQRSLCTPISRFERCGSNR